MVEAVRYRPLIAHLCTLIHTPKDPTERNDRVHFEHLKQEWLAKAPFCAPTFNDVEVTQTISRMDDKICQLQLCGAEDFLVPIELSGKLPPLFILQTVHVVLLCFGIPVDPGLTLDNVWTNVWTIWMVKNVDLHLKGWEWLSTGKRVGLFTHPQSFDPKTIYPVVHRVMEQYDFLSNTESRCQYLSYHFPAYVALHHWCRSVYAFLNLQFHYLPSFPMYR